MGTKFNFNSQVCSSIEQSRRLLALGLKKETADMVWLDYSLCPDVEDWRICADYEDWGTWQEGASLRGVCTAYCVCMGLTTQSKRYITTPKNAMAC